MELLAALRLQTAYLAQNAFSWKRKDSKMSCKKYILVFQLSRVLRTWWVYILIRKLNVPIHAALCAIANVFYLWCCVGFNFRRIDDTALKVCWKIQPNFPGWLKRPFNARIPPCLLYRLCASTPGHCLCQSFAEHHVTSLKYSVES